MTHEERAWLERELIRIEAAIAKQKKRRGEIPDDILEAGLAALRTLGGCLKNQITALSGSGAIAHAGGTAATFGGVAIGGNVYGDVYIGSAPQKSGEALRIYCGVLTRASGHLPLRGVDLEASDPMADQQRLDLARVYVDLDTKTQIPLTEGKEEIQLALVTRPLGALEAVIGHRRLVFLGDPGSGKSTFVNHLALCLAAHRLERRAGWLNRLPRWPKQEANAVPVIVILRDFARWLPEQTPQSEPHHLWEFIVSRLKAQNLAFATAPLRRALEAGRAIVLLDGLDEIPTKAQRIFVGNAIKALSERYPRVRVVVTCRTLSYQDPAWQLVDFPTFVLAPFDEGKIDHFINAWYTELARLELMKTEEAVRLAKHLREVVHQPDLRQLASNPLLLTVMALVHTHRGRLPDARALLYEDTVDILLWRWDQIKAGGDETAPRLRRLLLEVGRTDVDLKRVLWELAFRAHREGGAGDKASLADIGELRLEKSLARLHPQGSRDWAQQMIRAVKLRGGLLLERPREVFTFPHRTFQEYLAGAHLSVQAGFARRATQLVAEGAFWQEVVLLAVGRLVYLNGDIDKPLALVGELCPKRQVDDEVAWRQAWLAGEALLEMGLNRVQDSVLGQDLVRRVRDRLVVLVAQGRLRSVERAAAGRALAKLGDPRFRADAWYLLNEPLLGFVEIPAGSFLIGTQEEDFLDLLRQFGGESDWYKNDIPQRDISLPTYYIARHPVTQAQYWAFVQATGHRPPTARFEWERPYEWSNGHPPLHLLNHPVVLVTWDDARCYCDWLMAQLRTWKRMPEPLATLLCKEGWQVRLPTEAEWEKAARGTDGRIFPWGDEPDPRRANYSDTGIGTTSAVGCFPSGASPYGVLDLSGNVWEWTSSGWRHHGAQTRLLEPLAVLRGGAFHYNVRFVRCAGRIKFNMDHMSGNFGFRVVVVPDYGLDL
jgi:formylglycine-generating enzyme required for sulfatase activity